MLSSFLCISLCMLSDAAIAAGRELCTQPLRVIRNAEYEPDEDDRFLQAVLREAGCQLQVIESSHRVTLTRRFELLLAGEIDVIIGVSRLPEREMFGVFSVPFRAEKTRVWARAEDRARALGKSAEQLMTEGWRVIGPTQGWYGGFYESLRKRPGGVVAEYKRIKQGLRLLQGKRGDLLVADEVWLKRLPEQDKQYLYLLPDVLHEDALHLLYSRKHMSVELMARLDAAIKTVKSSVDATH